MKILYTGKNISWLPNPNWGRTVLATKLPSVNCIIPAFVFALDGDQLLMACLKSRG